MTGRTSELNYYYFVQNGFVKPDFVLYFVVFVRIKLFVNQTLDLQVLSSLTWIYSVSQPFKSDYVGGKN